MATAVLGSVERAAPGELLFRAEPTGVIGHSPLPKMAPASLRRQNKPEAGSLGVKSDYSFNQKPRANHRTK
jgi:hypothetical protein